MGVEMQATIGQAYTDAEARDKITAAIAQSFHVRSISPAPTPRPSLFAGLADGVKKFLK